MDNSLHIFPGQASLSEAQSTATMPPRQAAKAVKLPKTPPNPTTKTPAKKAPSAAILSRTTRPHRAKFTHSAASSSCSEAEAGAGTTASTSKKRKNSNAIIEVDSDDQQQVTSPKASKKAKTSGNINVNASPSPTIEVSEHREEQEDDEERPESLGEIPENSLQANYHTWKPKTEARFTYEEWQEKPNGVWTRRSKFFRKWLTLDPFVKNNVENWIHQAATDVLPAPFTSPLSADRQLPLLSDEQLRVIGEKAKALARAAGLSPTNTGTLVEMVNVNPTPVPVPVPVPKEGYTPDTNASPPPLWWTPPNPLDLRRDSNTYLNDGGGLSVFDRVQQATNARKRAANIADSPQTFHSFKTASPAIARAMVYTDPVRRAEARRKSPLAEALADKQIADFDKMWEKRLGGFKKEWIDKWYEEEAKKQKDKEKMEKREMMNAYIAEWVVDMEREREEQEARERERREEREKEERMQKIVDFFEQERRHVGRGFGME